MNDSNKDLSLSLLAGDAMAEPEEAPISPQEEEGAGAGAGSHVVNLSELEAGEFEAGREKPAASPLINVNYAPTEDETATEATTLYSMMGEDDNVEDKDEAFFQVGRDFEPSNVTHKFTKADKRKMQAFEALDYRKAQSFIYKQFLEKQAPFGDATKWAVFGLIGFMAGLVSFLMKQTIDLISEGRYKIALEMIERGSWVGGFLWFLFYGIIVVAIGSGLVVFLVPPASGSGVPEVMGYLNGVNIHKIFNIKTLIVKFLSCLCAVGSGLPVGPEGPMIHLGAMLGAGVSQGRSKTFGMTTRWFKQFRNTQDRRDFITGGAAAGVSAAFGAPVGGLLFVMEEVASFWAQKLTWMIFFGSMVATFTTDLGLSGFETWRWNGRFGFFDDKAAILFEVDQVVRLNVMAIFPTIVIGLMGGILGTLFTFLNLKVTRFRNKYFLPHKWRRIVEPIVIITVFSCACFFLTFSFGCQPEKPVKTQQFWHTEREVVRFMCEKGTYNAFATLAFSNGEEAIRHLFARQTGGEFPYSVLVTWLVLYFVFACYTAGTAISSGLVVPMLLIGATFGRIVGHIIVDLGITPEGHEWIDPGIFALVGAGAFFGGVSRLTIALTVIILEISNDIHFLLPIMIGIMIAKWVADFATHSLYHALLEVKCVPFLDHIPIVKKLDCFAARDVMAHPVVTLSVHAKVGQILKVLQKTRHNGFPVTSMFGDDPRHYFRGMILRSELDILLSQKSLFMSKSELEDVALGKKPAPTITFSHLMRLQDSEFKSKNRQKIAARLRRDIYEDITEDDRDKYLDLAPFINTSCSTINPLFSIQLTYSLFRSMGLRHLVVVNEHNGVCGIITRKDLLGQTIEERLADRVGHIAT